MRIIHRCLLGVLLTTLMVPAIGQARLVRTVGASAASAPDSTLADGFPIIEVFTGAGYPVVVPAALSGRVTVYPIDAIDAMEDALGEGLPLDPTQAKREAQRRYRGFSKAYLARLKHSSEGLGKARKYGLDRYPAIVFDGGAAVVYGMTDVEAALRLYDKR